MAQRPENTVGQFRHVGMVPAEVAFGKGEDGAHSGRQDVAEFAQDAADHVHDLGLLPDHKIAGAVDRQDRLLIFRLQFDEAHRGSAHRLANRLGIDRVGLAPLHIGFHIARRHQPDVVTELAQFAAPVMGGPTRLHPDDAGRQGLEELQKLGALHRLVENDAPIRGNPVNLKDILGQIQADRIDCHWVAPLSAVDDNCTMAHRDAGGAGAIHIIRFRDPRAART
ncbi:hypothetical protein A6024_18055 [Rhodovulum sulfidophilum]|nr:hypothetical protein A6W98_18250 [Rhodovulum sulfidophilum DSM 1374]ANB39649.1 hypothetical protein A6024_18055 [Rhodovulum sulfidophilum]